MFAQLILPAVFFLTVLGFFSWYLSPRIYLWWQIIRSNTHAACGCELTPFFGFDSIFTSIALAGLLLGIAIFLFFCWKLTRVLLQSRLSERCYISISSPFPRHFRDLVSSLHLVDRVEIIDQEKPAAFCHGYIFPRIIISRGMMQLLDQDELRAVLAHEKYHLVYRDPLRLLLFHTAATVFFFIPGLKRLFTDFQTQLELAADEMAINEKQDRKHLASALYALLEYQESQPVSFVLSFYGNTMERRIEALSAVYSDKKRKPWNFTLLSLFVLIAGLLVFMRFDRTALAEYDTGLCHPEYISQQCRDLVKPACVMSYQGQTPDCR